MARHWQSYRGGPTKTPAKVVNISISNKDVITLNRQAMEMLDNAEAAELVFEEKELIIGVIPSNLRNAEAFPLKRKNLSNWVINAAPFCRHFNIMVDRTERFTEPELDSDGVLCLDLKRTHNVSFRRTRARIASRSTGTKI